MRIAVKGFRGEAPRIAPHELPANGAQVAFPDRLVVDIAGDGTDTQRAVVVAALHPAVTHS